MNENESSGTTSIANLPSSENVTLSVQPKGESSVNMNELFKEIQENGQTGNLPSRDIPIDTNKVVMDETSKPNYIPEHEYYINEQEFESTDNVVQQKKRKDNQNASLEAVYEEIQIPILLGVIYFLFQLPAFNQMLMKYAAFAFRDDGGLNLYGVVVKSVLFAVTYYTFMKFFEQISE
jgi:hypothetical protein